ncbi:phytanoyl-CoA dioxygenase family protein [uncultured Microbulbifer sp.]|uniref:phytanoyl-CoA dioxygenase family protein n=1 Tax=uncultured Microbulbifer sp. TaxID=348147 RepID=UPI00344D4E89
MTKHLVKFNEDGFIVVPDIVSISEVHEISLRCKDLQFHRAGTRNLLNHNWIQALSLRISLHPIISRLLPSKAKSVQCTYFHKSKDKNWLVPLHRDTSIPVKVKFEAPDWDGWSKKEGVWFAKPPEEVLRNLVAVRVHLERNTIENGALQVIPGSHRHDEVANNRTTCDIPSGGALVMHPLILHSSSKLSSGRRRVLHFLYAPPTLPAPAEWAHAM